MTPAYDFLPFTLNISLTNQLVVPQLEHWVDGFTLLKAPYPTGQLACLEKSQSDLYYNGSKILSLMKPLQQSSGQSHKKIRWAWQSPKHSKKIKCWQQQGFYPSWGSHSISYFPHQESFYEIHEGIYWVNPGLKPGTSKTLKTTTKS